MIVHLTNPDSTITIQGPKQVRQLLQDLNLIPEANLVIRGDELVTEDTFLDDLDTIEIRSVISGG
ncbi:MAG: thiamine biosynthesis protein ThiS [Nitrospirales bacterium]|nr:thiamine biosynthesis protein ThiS [Nitrospirales bacterium]